jgi:PAS domain S-box-containing protein
MVKSQKILVVDDDRKMCASLKALLQQSGYTVESATGGGEALRRIDSEPFDLFLLDIVIPDLDGFQLLDHVLNQYPDIPVIMMTGDVSADSAIQALRKGAYDYLKKPFEPEELIKTAGNALRQKILLEKNRAMEKRLKISERRFRFMVQNSPDMIYTLDPQGRFTFVNEASEKLFGYRPADLMGKTYETVLCEDDLPRAQWRFNERRTGRRATNGFEVRLKSGPCKESEIPGNDVAVVELNATGVYRRRPAPEQNEHVGTYGVVRDMTSRKILETQLLQAKKLQALGNLAGGIAHDFNNLLMGIQGIVSLLLFRMEPDSPFLDSLKTIEQYVQDGAGLTRQLLSYARGGSLEVQPVDINALIRKQNRLFGRTHKEIRIEENLVSDVLSVNADSSQIEQVLLNVYVNAGHAMPEGGRLRVSSENVLIDAKHLLLQSTGLKPGRYVKITIRDTGHGMDEETQQRIFDPFFTTKHLGRGSGLGLYVSYGIIKNHGGHIQVVSRQNSGTSVTIHLPANHDLKAQPREPAPEMILGRETVLLVDDEEKIRSVCRDNLKLLGYSVITAESGKRALEIYQDKHDRIDVVVLDMIMPEMSGKETYRRLKQIDPECRVLVATGYTLEEDRIDFPRDAKDAFIQKPFKIEALSMMIQDMMHR